MVHSGQDLYGSDKMFLQSIGVFRKKYPNTNIDIKLPEWGKLAEIISALYPDIQIEISKIGIIRKHDLRKGDFRAVFLTLLFFNLKKSLRHYDLVYINTIIILDHIIAVAFFHKNTFIHIHEITKGLSNRIFRYLLLFSKAKLIFVSEATKTAYLPLPTSKYTVIPNCIEIPSSPNYTNKTTFLLKIGLFGRISSRKGHHILLEALKFIPDSIRTKIRIKIVGDVYKDQTKYLEGLKQLIVSNHFEDLIEFQHFTSDLIPSYNWADILVVPSILPESFSLVALEAMAMKLPVIASDTGGIKEVVEHNITGILIPPGNAPMLADAIIRFINSPESLINMGNAGYNRFLNHFSKQAYMTKLNNTLEDLS
jgi:glycosyltransferase involved in cell wall biosynthesis